MAAAGKGYGEDKTTPLAEQWPYVRFLGLGAWWAWIWLCYNSIEITRMFPDDQQTLLVVEMYLFSTLGIAASMFASAAGWKRVTALIDKRWFVVGFGAFAGLSTILLGFSVVMGTGVFFVLAAVFTGIGTSVLCLKTGRIYGSIPLGDSLTAGSISLVFAALLYFTGVGIPDVWRLFYLAALPLVSGLMLTMKSADPFHAEVSGAGEYRDCTPVRRLYRKLVAASALVALTAGVGKGVTGALVDNAVFAHTGIVTVFFVGVIAVLIVFAVNRGDAVRGARQVYSALMVLGVGMMLATCFGFDIALLSVGKESLWLVFSCFMTYLAFRYELSPVRVFGIGQGTYFLASAAGWGVGWFLSSYYDSVMVRMGTGIVLAFLTIMVLVYVFPENDLKRIMAWSVDGDVPHSGRGGVEKGDAGWPFPSELAADASVAPVGDSGLPAAAAFASMSGSGGVDVCSGSGGSPDLNPGFGSEAETSVSANTGVSSGSAASACDRVESAAVSGRRGEGERKAGLARAADPHYGLSARELEILGLFAQGRSANWIADSLVISKNTVRSHLRAIYTKLDVHTRQELLDFLAE